jgi:hypothetical protein
VRNLQFATNQGLSLRDGIHAAELEHQHSLVRPHIVDLQFAPLRLQLAQRKQVHAFGKAARNSVQFGGDFAVAALRFHDARQRDEIAACFRIQCAGGTSRG